MPDFIEEIEIQESLEKLRKNGYGDFIDTFLLNENKVYTKKGRLNKSGACRAMESKPKQLDDVISSCRKLLEKDFGLNETEEADG